MKDTRKLSLVYFAISVVLLLFVCFGCERNSVDYVHTVNECDVFYVETDKEDEVIKTANKLMNISDNFVLIYILKHIPVCHVPDGHTVIEHGF